MRPLHAVNLICAIAPLTGVPSRYPEHPAANPNSRAPRASRADRHGPARGRQTESRWARRSPARCRRTAPLHDVNLICAIALPRGAPPRYPSDPTGNLNSSPLGASRDAVEPPEAGPHRRLQTESRWARRSPARCRRTAGRRAGGGPEDAGLCGYFAVRPDDQASLRCCGMPASRARTSASR